MLIALTVLGGLTVWGLLEMLHAGRTAPLGCDDCQGLDPWCICHVYDAYAVERKS